MKLELPQQLSSVPEIDGAAMGWASNTVDTLNRLFANIHALAFFQSTGTFAAAVATGPIAFSNLAALRLPNGQYLTPKLVLTGCSLANTAGRIDVQVTVTAVAPGGCTVQLWTPGAAFTDTVAFWLLLLA